MSRIFLATNGKELSRVEQISGEWQVTTPLSGIRINCLVSDPHQRGRVYASTQEHGVLVSLDLGKTWQPAGMAGVPVKSLAANPSKPGLIYAGCKPVSLYVTKNGGESWNELEVCVAPGAGGGSLRHNPLAGRLM